MAARQVEHVRAAGRQQETAITELVKGLTEDVSSLISQHLALAKAELSEKAKEARAGAGMFGGAGIVGLMALGALLASFIAGLATVMPVWAAALAVAAVLGAAAGALFLAGKTKIGNAAPPVPQQTIESVKDTKDELQYNWARGHG